MSKRLDILEEKFLNTVKENNLINENDVIVVGVSGGPDSIALLSCLNKYKEKFKCKIVVAHINHLIRKDSTDDEQFVENACKKMNIPFYKKRVEVEKIAKDKKRGTEETGRIIRYEFFDEVAKKVDANKIAIAHNMNDNAETILLNILRGCGMSGLEGIQAKEYGKYIRPLINCSREEIENYCEKNKLNPRIDSTNKENIYTRNIVRNKILPELQEINPNFIKSVSRMSKIVKTNNEYIRKQSHKIYDEILYKEDKKSISIKLKKFNIQEDAIKENVILIAFENLTGSNKNIEKSKIDEIVKIANRNVGNKYLIINKEVKVEIKNGYIILSLNK